MHDGDDMGGGRRPPGRPKMPDDGPDKKGHLFQDKLNGFTKMQKTLEIMKIEREDILKFKMLTTDGKMLPIPKHRMY